MSRWRFLVATGAAIATGLVALHVFCKSRDSKWDEDFDDSDEDDDYKRFEYDESDPNYDDSEEIDWILRKYGSVDEGDKK